MRRSPLSTVYRVDPATGEATEVAVVRAGGSEAVTLPEADSPNDIEVRAGPTCTPPPACPATGRSCATPPRAAAA